jgi:hypothetical protein
MANTYTWDFPTLDTAPSEDGLSDVIKTIHWRITAVSDSETDADGNAISASMYGTASAGEVDADNFVAFDSVTKDWCKTKVLDSLSQTEAEVQATLDSKIDSLANPPMVQKVPAGW